VLVRRTHARKAARHDFAALGNKLPEQPVVLVVDVFDLFDAELANLFAPEELASAGCDLRLVFRLRYAAASRSMPLALVLSFRLP
jgi:hypothetical protein